MILVNIPVREWYSKLEFEADTAKIIALSLVLALGLDQAPRTQRWRLLLMTEGEEMAWARRK
jgi:hypothetical protein